MILSAALPTAPDHAPAAPSPAGTPEIGAGFAVLLGAMLKTGTADHAAIPGPDESTCIGTAPIGQQMPGTSDGTPLSNDVPPALIPIDTETPEFSVAGAIITPLPVAVLIPVSQIAPSVENTSATQDTAPQPAVTVRPVPVQLAEGSPADPRARLQPQQQQHQQQPQPQPPRGEQTLATPAVTVPRLVPATGGETAAAVSPARTRIIPASLEGDVAPAPATPQLTFAVPETSASVTGASAPSSAPAAPNLARPQAPHDFATLVDRLVEARDTARATQSPQAVSASLAHAQFGDITMRFEHGSGTALSVALSNPDPEFTRAVQAATPTAQASDSGTAPGRHDASGQTTGGSAGQSSQSQNQRGAGSPPRGAAHPHAPDEQPGRSGIFA